MLELQIRMKDEVGPPPLPTPHGGHRLVKSTEA